MHGPETQVGAIISRSVSLSVVRGWRLAVLLHVFCAFSGAVYAAPDELSQYPGWEY